MAKKIAKKRKYPESLNFDFMGFVWQIKFLDIETENFGITDCDEKVVHIYYKNKTHQNVIECLIHELEHVVLFDMAESIFHYDGEKIADKEENAVRLTSPRLFHLIKDNIDLFEFLLKQIKECK